MILFHVPRIDSGDLSQWQRTILPAHLLRRGGMPTRIVAGGLDASDLRGASAIVFGGPLGAGTAELSRRARAAGLRVILDLADTRPLVMDPVALRSAAEVADLIIAANPNLAALAAARLEPRCATRAIADVPIDEAGVPDVLATYPTIGLKILAGAVKIRAVDAVRCVRHWLQNGAQTPPRNKGIRIVWFGDGTGLNQEGGLGELLLAAGDLVDLSQDVPFRLRVIGASRRLFRRSIGRLPIQAEFRRLTVSTLARDLRSADLCFLPGGGDAASRARSAARVEIARDLGIPVLTAPHGGLTPSPRLTLASDWPAALRGVVAGRKVRDEISVRRDIGAIHAAWRGAVAEAVTPPGDKPAIAPRRLRVLFLLQQFQDLDLICPVAEAAAADMQVTVAILTKIAIPATRRLQRLRALGGQVAFWRARNLDSGKVVIAAGDFDAAMTASDGPGRGARHAAAFVRIANATGIATFNLQHGLDNSGLTFGGPPTGNTTQFNARFVLTWGGFERLTEAADPATRAKVIPVGCPKTRARPEDAADFPLAGRRFVAVFENLHWWRYSNTYRNRFVEDLIEAARAAPDMIFVLKPHMGGQWFTRTSNQRPLPDNLIVADPGAPQWRRFAADSFLAHAAGAITTPSTIALDAARYDLPTALVGYGLPADNYAPLFRIEEASDWTDFVQQVRTGSHDMTKIRQFHDLSVIPGDAVTRILDVMRLATAGRSQAEILAAVTRESGTVPA